MNSGLPGPRPAGAPASPARPFLLLQKCANPGAFVHTPTSPTHGRAYKARPCVGGEGGIRTLDGVSTHTPLAGERLQPLGHLSVENPLRRMILDHPAR